ncbi:response regulator [Geobacter hydrogenophilus]|uniref:Two-component system response regulator n=1 Tax=Geobacter hydrogenophilus TaxID=40983 RepID=A0A9W6FZL8_9BACT|nr:response regulator [Geobacter hydrogenophilus]MBT0893591.1 response regulator [Geobacter hydrogenophilus]GLI37712.1 two-component system response regulator [Geobacter hydrogenophilus]
MKPPSVLLVDDERFFLSVQRDFLKGSPIAVLSAPGGEEALRIAREQRPDLIYLDCRMPEMDGVACCTILKGDRELRTIPVLMMVQEGKEKDRERCLAAGCDGIIAKPIDRREFLEAGRRFVPEVERRHQRIRCGSLAVFRRGDASFHGSIEDISFCGVYVGSRCDVKIEDRIQLGFFLPGSDLIETDARVAWVNQGHRRIKPTMPEGFGVEFVGIAAEAADQVKRYIAAYVPR